jgi:carbon monoxide dehydrogenase subunit G
MATLHKDIVIAAPREFVWDALRDIGALHTRLVPGFVVNTRVEGETRIVTFGNGMVVREPILSIDDRRCRLAWGAEGAPFTHYNAVIEVFATSEGSRVVWTTDLLPRELEQAVGAMQDQALATMKATLEASASTSMTDWQLPITGTGV